MTTYPKMPSTPAYSLSEPISEFDLAFERQRLRNKIHDIVLGHFLREVAESGLTRAQLARKLNRRPEQITRWLSGPGNLTTDTISDLMYAMGLDPASILQKEVTAPSASAALSSPAPDKKAERMQLGSVMKYLQKEKAQEAELGMRPEWKLVGAERGGAARQRDWRKSGASILGKCEEKWN